MDGVSLCVLVLFSFVSLPSICWRLDGSTAYPDSTPVPFPVPLQWQGILQGDEWSMDDLDTFCGRCMPCIQCWYEFNDSSWYEYDMITCLHMTLHWFTKFSWMSMNTYPICTLTQWTQWRWPSVIHWQGYQEGYLQGHCQRHDHYQARA